MLYLETPRLCLRNLRPEDADAMYDYRNHPLCARYQRGQIRDRAGIAQLIERRSEDMLSTERPFMAAIAHRQTQELVGEIVAMPNDGTICLGYTISYRYHRRGYAFEALSALIDTLHRMAPEQEFLCFTDPENTASMGLLEKLGYRNLGYLPAKNSQVFGKWTKVGTESEIAQLSQKSGTKHHNC